MSKLLSETLRDEPSPARGPLLDYGREAGTDWWDLLIALFVTGVVFFAAWITVGVVAIWVFGAAGWLARVLWAVGFAFAAVVAVWAFHWVK